MGEHNERCVCAAHPCWDHNGQEHRCDKDSGFPFLTFQYSESRELQCSCSSIPQYGSTYIHREKCPGHACENDSEHPFLDWDKDSEKCVCKRNPCHDLQGQKHE